MKLKTILIFATLLCVACHKTDNTGGGSGGDEPSGDYVAPEAPSAVNQSNLFNVDFFTDLQDAPYFTARDYNVAVTHILAQTGKRPLIYMFDRSDFAAGVSYPHVNIAYKCVYNAFFAQNKTSGSTNEGTGMVTPYLVSSYDGVGISDKVYASGCTLPAPLSAMTSICLYTCRIDSVGQIKALVEVRGSVLQNNGCVIGTIRPDAFTGAAEWLKKNFKDFRFVSFATNDTPYVLFVFSPVWYVCRVAEYREVVNLPYYRISIEKLDSTIKL